MKVIKDFNNKLLKRREALVSIESPSNPGISEATKKVAEHFKTGEEVVVIKSLKSSYGKSEFVADVLIYDSLEAKESTEPKKREKKGDAN